MLSAFSKFHYTQTLPSLVSHVSVNINILTYHKYKDDYLRHRRK